MDDADTIRSAWQKKGIYEVLETLYSEIWVYGIREFYDPVEEYDIPESIARKMVFTGYIPRKVPPAEEVAREKKRHCIREGKKLVVVTTGGGGDGYAVMDTYLTMLEAMPRPHPFRSILVTGPFMPGDKRSAIHRRARKLGVRAFHFYRQMEKLLAAADVVIGMGGYNTLCEVLSQKTVTLLVPRETPRLEQLIRARSFHRQNLVAYIPWKDLTPDTLRPKIEALLERPEPFQEAISRFRMTGLDVMRQRLACFRTKTQ
jgi:predicted glycosyltransferase